jgi:hypothetical protein
MVKFEQFKSFLSEGKHDPGIFHAVFIAGGPGSGKDFVTHHIFDGHGLHEINSDIPFEHLLNKHGLDKTMPDSEKEQRNAIRDRAKHIADLKQKLSLSGRNGIIINGTGSDFGKYQDMKRHLESLGYKTHMVFVHTDDHVSKDRNIRRGLLGGRTVPEHIRSNLWNKVQGNKDKFRRLFGDNYHEINNSLDKDVASRDHLREFSSSVDKLYKHFRKHFSDRKNYTKAAQEWLKNQ